eukprot:3064038-Pyramimonas_sp.AAC.1
MSRMRSTSTYVPSSTYAKRGWASAVNGTRGDQSMLGLHARVHQLCFILLGSHKARASGRRDGSAAVTHNGHGAGYTSVGRASPCLRCFNVVGGLPCARGHAAARVSTRCGRRVRVWAQSSDAAMAAAVMFSWMPGALVIYAQQPRGAVGSTAAPT